MASPSKGPLGFEGTNVCGTRTLPHFFGLLGHPLIYHSENGKEASSREILDILIQIDSGIIPVTGRVRTPHDQGSVESANKTIKRAIQKW